MNWFVKYMLIPGLTLGATIGATTGVTLHLNNKKHKNDYNLGYSNALSDKAYYESQLSEFDKLRNEYINQIAELVAKNEELTTQNTQKERQITSLTADNEQKASRISVLESENNEYQSTIENLRAEKTTLESRVAELQKSETDKTSEIAKLNIQISNLQQQITSYQTLIATNTQTISTLNETIKTQQAQITKLQEDLKQSTMSSKEYTDKIAELQKTVEYLESYVNGTLGDQQVSVKFMFDNSLYNLQVLNKGSFASVTDPQSTPYVKFNYWMKDGYQVTLAETPISENTTFVANVTYSYDVKFMNEQQQMKAEIVESGHYPTKPEQDPTKDGYEFDGWTLNGVDVVDPTQTEITGTTIFTAKFTKLHNVKFESGIEHDETQQVRDGERPTAYSSAEMQREGYEFDGWTLNDRIVTPEEIDIYNDTTFVAKWTQVHTVTYIVDGQQTTEKVRHGEHVKNVPSASKEYSDFDGWFIVDRKIDDINNYEINEDTTFTAKFTQIFDRVLANNSPDVIATISDIIASKNMTSQQVEETFGWKVGDKIDIPVGEQTVTILILDFNVDVLSDGSGKAGITFGMKDLLSVSFRYASNESGWDGCVTRTKVLVDIFSKLSPEWQKIIKSVNKNATNYVPPLNVGNVTTSSDKLWLLSVAEIYSKNNMLNSDDSVVRAFGEQYLLEGKQYAYYHNLFGDATVGTVNNYLVKNLNGVPHNWFLRSSDGYHPGDFVNVTTSGNFDYDIGHGGPAISFCFCI